MKIVIPVGADTMNFTLQWLFVLLAGLLLGSRRAFRSVAVYLITGLIGFPVFARGGGPAYLLRPTFGFLLGFALAADEADMTVGDRISNGAYGKENERPFHNFGNNLVRRLIKVIYGYAFEDVMTGYRAFTRAFVKTMPVMSGGFQIETEISIWAVDRRWRVADVPIDYRDRPEGSESKLSTFSDGMLVLAAIASLFRDYRPMAFFGWLGLALAVVGLCFGLPVVAEYFDTGYVAKLPSAVLAVALMIVAALSWTAGLILDTVAKSHRRQWEMSVYRVMEADAER